MKRVAALLFLFAVVLCGCVSKPQTAQQQLAERLDFANSSSYCMFSPQTACSMAEQYFSEIEFLAAQQKDRRLVLELTSVGTVFYHASGLKDLLAAGESTRILSKEKQTPLCLNCFSAIAQPGTQGFLWHLLDAPPAPIRPFVDALPGNTLAAGYLDMTPQAVMTALKKYADKTPLELDALCRKNFQKSASEVLDTFSGRWEILLFAADKKIHFKLTVPDRAGYLAPVGRIAVPFLKQLLPPDFAPPQISSADGKLVLMSQNAEKLLAKSGHLLKNAPDLDYLLKHLPQKGNGFFYCGSDFSKLFLPPLIAQRGKVKLPFSLGVILSNGSAYDVQSLSNCTPEELQFFAAMLLPLRRWMEHFLTERRSEQQTAQAERRRDMSEKQCAARLKVIGGKLHEYAKQHNGKFPGLLTDLELAGAGLLCPANQYAPYVYFSGFTTADNPKFPLVCDYQPHGKELNVLLLNGELLSIAQDGIGSLKRTVSILHSRFRYSEKELQMLLEKISAIDKTMEQ
ncbi:MAG: hypothetical protein IJW17_06080 [Lentisphaeria bacterium]|nr:hypothetical protein [Lentisphaeria bacterium]